MTGQETERKKPLTHKEKRDRHASAQASYMQRRREAGQDWLATWVPAEAKETLKVLAQKMITHPSVPTDPAQIMALETHTGLKVPEWARGNRMLFDLWCLAYTDAHPTHTPSDPAIEQKEKPKKDKKKKKKK